MDEIYVSDINEAKMPSMENYNNIRPENKYSSKEIDGFWKNEFNTFTGETQSDSLKGKEISTCCDDVEKAHNISDVSNIGIDYLTERIEKYIGTPEGIKSLIEKYPEKAKLWTEQLNSMEIFDNPDATPFEIKSAQNKLNILKGQLFEAATKTALEDMGFDVESQQRLMEGENGMTKPDVVAQNNTDKPINFGGSRVSPGKKLSAECKCGSAEYLNKELDEHIPNQLSGQEGTRVLVTTSDIRDVPIGKAESVCEKYDAKLVTLDISSRDVENAIKGAAG